MCVFKIQSEWTFHFGWRWLHVSLVWHVLCLPEEVGQAELKACCFGQGFERTNEIDSLSDQEITEV